VIFFFSPRSEELRNPAWFIFMDIIPGGSMPHQSHFDTDDLS